MGFSKDDEGGEGPGLSLVSVTTAADLPAPEGSDKTTLLKLAQLRLEHRELDDEIQALIAGGPIDQLHLTRLKKRKLMLRDQIAKIEDSIVPDIIA